LARPAFHRTADQAVADDIETDFAMLLGAGDRIDYHIQPLLGMMAPHCDEQAGVVG
jgi:hypothetical protein